MHASIGISKTGASAIAKGTADNPREMLLRLIEEHAGATKDELFSLFQERIEEDPGYQRAVAWYFFVNMYEYACTSRNHKPDPVQRAELQAAQRERIERIKAQIVMLDLTMPNGKPMRECTGAEMAKFGNRYQKIAERVGKTKIVGAVLTEDDVRGIMR